ncbi:DUF1064 domain-containing protein [Limosilactobacillus mucosae]|uniref:DUF1064 domain-containing protein n=1 Tax=Limosilactobacillus mucosae TaxID=97478 RepID=UPI0008832D15|nr:DUF1064 domain-containing protein [Limosilactobacillus mucosae]SDN12205.1 Protein of unknown function [Limosilactobacillus mucosae]SEK61185.1 Protein of unknown function [Limosilactobacillus mucosae]SFK01679.1 Protein of unknown function [Limosilactobacillus mucosae]
MKHYGRKVKLDGYTFDSQKEASFYAAYIKNCGKKYAVHPQYQLMPIYDAGMARVGAIYYRPDFVVYGPKNVIEHVYDVKTSVDYQGVDSSAQLRFKLFWRKYGIPVEVVTPLRSYFKVKILGTTTKTQPMHQRIKRDGTIVKDYYDIKTSIDYKVEELLEGERDGKQRG